MSQIVSLKRIARRFPLMGIVKGHNVVVAQAWRRVARGNLPNVAVLLDKYQLHYLNASVRRLPVHHKFGCVMPELPAVISVPISEAKHSEYRIGDRVELVVGYVSVTHQDVRRARPLEVIECTVTDTFLRLVPKTA